MSRYQQLAVLLLAFAAASTTEAFTVGPAAVVQLKHQQSVAARALFRQQSSLCASTENKEGEAASSAFVPLEEEDDNDDDDTLEKVEMLGKGAAKVGWSAQGFGCPDETKSHHRSHSHLSHSFSGTHSLTHSLTIPSSQAKRGKRKGSSAPASAAKVKTNLAPEETYYEGPPAITETIAPTISILTVVGIIPAAAAWARQAWVRYKITNRRIRVTSGIGGKDMAEIVYPDIVELRTAKRLFGDGDLVAFLRDGAKFEMRNIPDFDDAIEFILDQVDKDVAKQYREKGDVTKPPP